VHKLRSSQPDKKKGTAIINAAFTKTTKEIAAELKIEPTKKIDNEKMAVVGVLEGVTPAEYRNIEKDPAVKKRVGEAVDNACRKYQYLLAKNLLWTEVSRPDFGKRLPAMLGARSYKELKQEDVELACNLLGGFGPAFQEKIIQTFTPAGTTPKLIKPKRH